MTFILILFFAAYPYQGVVTILLPEVVIPLILALFPLEWVVIFFLGFLSHLKISKLTWAFYSLVFSFASFFTSLVAYSLCVFLNSQRVVLDIYQLYFWIFLKCIFLFCLNFLLIKSVGIEVKKLFRIAIMATFIFIFMEANILLLTKFDTFL